MANSQVIYQTFKILEEKRSFSNQKLDFLIFGICVHLQSIFGSDIEPHVRDFYVQLEKRGLVILNPSVLLRDNDCHKSQKTILSKLKYINRINFELIDQPFFRIPKTTFLEKTEINMLDFIPLLKPIFKENKYNFFEKMTEEEFQKNLFFFISNEKIQLKVSKERKTKIVEQSPCFHFRKYSKGNSPLNSKNSLTLSQHKTNRTNKLQELKLSLKAIPKWSPSPQKISTENNSILKRIIASQTKSRITCFLISF